MKRTRTLAAAAVAVASLLLSGASSVSAAAQTCTWTGTAGDSKFSTAGNWSGCGTGAPQTGDKVQFNVISGTSSVNIDNTGVTTALSGVITGGSGSATTYILSDSLVLQNGAVWDGAGSAYISYLSSNTNAKTTAQGSVTIASGGMPKLFMTTGDLILKSGVSFGGMSATVTPSGITVENGASLACLAHLVDPTIAAPLTLGGGSSTTPPAIEYGFCAGGALATDPALTLTIAKVTLLGDATVSVYGNDTVKITELVANGHTISLNKSGTHPSDGTLVTPTGTQTVTYQAKATQLDGDKSTENVTVQPKETATLNGKRCGIWVKTTGLLKGVGELCSLTLDGGATVSPGNSPGTITMSGSLLMAPGSTYTAEIASKDSYDKLIANGVQMNDVILDLKFLAGAKIAAGDTYNIISNTGSGPVSGTFRGLDEGAVLSAAGGTFKISYKGGDGNDITLTVQKVPTVPNTGFELIKASPLITLAVAIVGALTILALARKRSSARR